MTAHAHDKFKQALSLHQKGQLAQAEELYEDLLRTNPRHVDALHLLGMIAYQKKDHQRAAGLFDQAIAIRADNPAFYFSRGVALKELKHLDAAVASYDKAIALKPDFAEAFFSRGAALRALKQLEAAVASYDQAITLKPDYAEAHSGRGLALKELKQLDAAVASYDQAIALKPDYAEAYSNRGVALKELKQLDAAVASYDQAIALKPDYAEAYSGRGVVQLGLKQLEAAVASYDKAIALKPDYAEAYSNRGNALQELKQMKAAIASYNKAIAINPELAKAHAGLADALMDLKRYDLAVESFDRAIAINPEAEYLLGMRLHAKGFMCDWSSLTEDLNEIILGIEQGKKVTTAFPVLSLTTDLSLQRKAAEISVTEEHPVDDSLGGIAQRVKPEKLRIGYYSADYHDHPMSYLIAEMIELHDRTRFDVIGFSLGPDDQGETRQRISSAFDKFIDVRDQTDEDVALLSRSMEIDIAIDLNGYTMNSRTGIFSLRAAPIQVNYMGFPGTLGAQYIEYIIADKTIIPERSKEHYTEKVVYLPDTYQANDRKRIISDKIFSRSELGLPETGFVFCCFNNNYKITPQTFDGWMRILQNVDGSVLWLFEANPFATDNLRKEALKRGVDPQRLIFAKRLPLPEHLARHRAADLFIDTLPYNAHTTASDALWAGLPVLTLMGESFASRVAASLLNAIELPELIVHTQDEFEELAVALATNPDRLQAIKQKLDRNRLTTPLFDSQLFTDSIEDAYGQMYERHHAGLPPDDISVA